jgi:sugar-specific transcriptional regulator TrmB
MGISQKMTEKQQILEDIGFSKNESIVYLTVLRLGSCTATEITKESNIHRSNVYDALESLIKKGCIAYVFKKDVKHFEATNPENLSNILKEKQVALSVILPQLLEKKKTQQNMSVNIYEGYTNLKKMFNHFVDKGGEYLSYGVPMQLPEKLRSWLDWHHKHRISKKVPIKLIFDASAKERAKVVNKIELAEAKYFTEKFEATVTTEISGDEVLIILWSENPLTINIKCKEIADSYKNYFNLLWSTAESPE